MDSAPNRSAIAVGLAELVRGLVSEGATLELVAVDDVIRRVTSQYTRLEPLANVVCGPGEVFAAPGVAWS